VGAQWWDPGVHHGDVAASRSGNTAARAIKAVGRRRHAYQTRRAARRYGFWRL